MQTEHKIYLEKCLDRRKELRNKMLTITTYFVNGVRCFKKDHNRLGKRKTQHYVKVWKEMVDMKININQTYGQYTVSPLIDKKIDTHE